MSALDAILPLRLGFGPDGPSVEAGEAAAPRRDDVALVDDYLRTGRDETFELLVDAHKDKVFRFVLAILGPGLESEAEEVTQETFVTAFRQLASFRRESRFGTWLCRIAQRKAFDLRRTPRLRHPHAAEEVLAALPAGQDAEGDSHLRAEARQHQAALLAAMRALPDPYPAVLRLFYWLGWSVPEIAESLGAPVGTVKSHLFRAREALHQVLKKKGQADARSML